ncbi:MAG: hypothetical protein Q8R36_04740 [bacterium]|nr:hypothetical protein [bacterium]
MQKIGRFEIDSKTNTAGNNGTDDSEKLPRRLAVDKICGLAHTVPFGRFAAAMAMAVVNQGYS